jgi:predicted alpha/beta superfamily hydrolase
LFSCHDFDKKQIETFTFSNNGVETKGKIYLPVAYKVNKNLPVIYLIDFTEQHFKLATDEFEKVIDAVEQLEIDALVVSLANIPDIDAEPKSYQYNYDVYKNMASYVDKNYSSNLSRTFIGKGSEASVVLMTLFLEDKETSLFENFISTDPSPSYADAIFKVIESNDFPEDKSNKKLHFSFTTSNDRDKCSKFINLIKEAQYPWLQFQSKEYTDSNYENTYPIAFTEGLQYIFKN